jgi:starch synthase
LTLPVLAVASEAYPVVKTGGLGDVVGALPRALASEGIDVRTLVPGYRDVLRVLDERVVLRHFHALQGVPAQLMSARAADLDLLVLDAPHLFDRPGNLYLGIDGKPWPDNAQRFAALAQAAAAIAADGAGDFMPRVVHAHDWQAGLAPAYVHFMPRPRPASVTTIHNLAFQGLFQASVFASLGLPSDAFGIDGVEYYGDVSYLKAGIAYADAVTTVSPTYAAEIRTPEGGMGLDGLLRKRSDALVGIRNGIDETVWDPRHDAHLAARYDATSLEARSENKSSLQRRLGLDVDPDALLFVVVSRLTAQKGSDLVLDTLPVLLRHGAQLAVLGTGDRELERRFEAVADVHRGRVAVEIGFEESLAHRLYGGADALLMPSRFEPCGLAQMIAMRYGVVPVAARVGGLADTIVDANEMALAARAGTGVLFAPVSSDMLAWAIERTCALWRTRARWRAMQRRSTRSDVSWRDPARAYAALFRAVAAASAGSVD